MKTALAKKYKVGDCICVYSLATGRVRRTYASDTDDEIKDVDIAPGEAVLYVDAEKGLKIEDMQARVKAATGKEPVSDRYVLIDPAGKILGSLIADPTCGDKAEHFGAGYTMLAHDYADPTWTYDAKTGELIAPPRPDPIPGRS